jgi:CRISPR-associated endonuclease Cas1
VQLQLTNVVNSLRRTLTRDGRAEPLPAERSTSATLTDNTIPNTIRPASAVLPVEPSPTQKVPRAKRAKRANLPGAEDSIPPADAAPASSDESPIICGPVPVANGLAVVYGYGVKVNIMRGHLFVSDGICDQRRAGYFNRATSGLRHLVILGHTGSVSLDAFRWLHQLGAGVSMIDADGEVIFTSAPLGADNVHLRRAQALAAYTDVGLDVTRHLLMAKVAGQARVLRARGRDDAAKFLDAAVDTLEGTTNLADMRGLEAHAADAYFSCWAMVPVQWSRKYAGKVPEHWLTFGRRRSGKGGNAMQATTPANAILNYLYAILETEARIALLTVGLDPSLGILHADKDGRASLALDVMETLRPDVDTWLLNVLASRVFSPTEFVELPDGVCRISAKLTRELAETAPRWRALLGPVVERVASSILAAHKPTAKLALHLTHTHHRTAVQRSLAHRTDPGSVDMAPVLAISPPAGPPAKVAASCVECGKTLVGRQTKYCSPLCQAHHNRALRPTRYSVTRDERAVLAAQNGPAESRAGGAPRSPLVEERQTREGVRGSSPTIGTGVTAKRKQATADKARERAVWEAEHPEVNLTAERQRYQREILPRLGNITLPIRDLAEALGLSSAYAARIGRGEVVPHPMYFAPLVELLDLGGNK